MTSYQGSTHGTTGAVLLLTSAILTVIDLLPILWPIKRKIQELDVTQSLGKPKWMPKFLPLRFWTRTQNATPDETEYLPMIHSPEMVSSRENLTPEVWKDDLRDEVDMLESSHQTHFRPRASPFSSTHSHSVDLSRERSRLLHRHSLGSDHSTLHEDHPSLVHRPVRRLESRAYVVGRLIRTIVERGLIVYGWGQMLSGMSVYYGLGRAQYINGILAHFISTPLFKVFGFDYLRPIQKVQSFGGTEY